MGPTLTHECSKAAFLALAAAESSGRNALFKDISGLVTVVINVAHPSSQTPQNINSFKELSQLCEDCSHAGVEVIAFPSDQFAGDHKVSLRTPSTSSRDSIATLKRQPSTSSRESERFHMMQPVHANGPDEHPVYSFLKAGGPDIRGPFQTAFIVACGEERCSVHRYDGRPPRALRARVDALVSKSARASAELQASEEVEASLTQVV